MDTQDPKKIMINSYYLLLATHLDIAFVEQIRCEK